MAVRIVVLWRFRWPSLWGLKDARRQSRLRHVGYKSRFLVLCYLQKKTCKWQFENGIVSWHWRLGLFCCWPQFGGRAGMINVPVISSPWATVDAAAENYGGVDTEKGLRSEDRQEGGSGAVAKVSPSFLQIKTQQVEPDRLSGELDTQAITESLSFWPSQALNF